MADPMISTLDRIELMNDDLASEAVRLMASGGDQRIVIDAASGLNRYLVAPRPDPVDPPVLAYSSSTASSISPAAFAEVQRRLAVLARSGTIDADDYAAALESLRGRLRISWQLPSSVDVVFAASGTDLEFAGLALAHDPESQGIDNILLGANEVGSGCIHSAKGQFFAGETPLGIATQVGQPVAKAWSERIRLVDVPVRTGTGLAHLSEDLLLEIALAVDNALRAGRVPLIHVVHGSKTGLILPSLDHIDALRRRYGAQVRFVVDSCQVRISREFVAAYLSRGCAVFLTGSKYVGGPPFSGFALIPRMMRDAALPLPPGFEALFRQAEWPQGWPGASSLPHSPNAGLLLRLEAAMYEMELYHRLSPAEIRRSIDIFNSALGSLTARLGVTRLAPSSQSHWDEALPQPQEIRSLATIDLSNLGGTRDYEDARCIYMALARPDRARRARGHGPVRLGQPAKCIRLADGRFGANLRIGLSMPQMVGFAGLDSASLHRKLHDDMALIADAIDGLLREGY